MKYMLVAASLVALLAFTYAEEAKEAEKEVAVAENKEAASDDKKHEKRGLFDVGLGYGGHGGFDSIGHLGGGGYGHDEVHKTVTVVKKVPVPYPVEKHIPYPVEKKIPYPVKVPVDNPVPVHVEKPVPVPVEKPVPYPVEKPVPYPVKVPVDNPVPVHVEKPVPYPVKVPVPAPYPVEKLIPYPVEKKVPVPVKVPVDRPYPVHIEKHIPYHVEKHVPYPVKVPVPVIHHEEKHEVVQEHESFGQEELGSYGGYEGGHEYH
ncbi:hypothetical protein ACJJTC_009341 [Scirpophaga incertulas]